MTAWLPTQRRSSPSPKGVTLIELLVVVAVICALAAILLPSLGHARSKAKILLCQTRLRELTVAWTMYLDTHHGRFLQGTPRDNWHVNYGGRQGAGSRWFGAKRTDPKPKPLNVYVALPKVVREGAEIFCCPADRGNDARRPSHFEYCGTSYLMNLLLVGQGGIAINRSDPYRDIWLEVNERLPGLRRSRLANESKLLLMGDFGWHTSWYFDNDPSDHFSWHGKADRHNMAFMDGHASFIKIDKGLATTAAYTVIPFGDLQDRAVEDPPEGH